MSSASMYSEDHFVLLLPGEVERILSATELTEQLKVWVLHHADALPPDVAQQPSPDAQAEALREGSCELELEPGRTAQWYAIRLEK
jgi:hypothetical protein